LEVGKPQVVDEIELDPFIAGEVEIGLTSICQSAVLLVRGDWLASRSQWLGMK
jgi:hypothetical protein